MTRRPPLLAAGLLALLASASAAGAEASPASDPPQMFALIVGNNASLDPSLPHLRYADDDAARYFDLFTMLGARVELLSVLDPDSQVRFPEATQAAQMPTRDGVLAAAKRLQEEIEAAGPRRSVFYFVFSGHGSLSRTYEGYLHLLDGRFSRSDLLKTIIEPSSAAFNHVILDACQAYFLVASRGDSGDSAPDFRAAIRGFVRNEEILRHPNTGVILSSARDLETQEWSAYEAGVFTHGLLSGLTGAADVDGDGRVGYAEIRAFLTAVHQRVEDPRAHLAILARPPAMDVEQPLIDLRGFHGARLRFPRGVAGRYRIENDRGVRYADLHKAAEGEVTIRLSHRPHYFLRQDGNEARVVLWGDRGTIDASLLPWSTAVASRGAVQDTFQRGLFAVAFGPDFFQGYTASTAGAMLDITLIDGAGVPELPDEGPASLRPWAWTTLGLAVAGAVGAGISGGLASRAHGQLEHKFNTEGVSDPELMARVDQRRLAANALLATSIASAVASLVLFLVEPTRAGPSRAPDSGRGVAVTPDIDPVRRGMLLRLRLEWE